MSVVIIGKSFLFMSTVSRGGGGGEGELGPAAAPPQARILNS